MSCDKPTCSGCDCGKHPFVNTPDIDKTAAEEMPDDYHQVVNNLIVDETVDYDVLHSPKIDSIDKSVRKMMDDLEIVGDLTIPTDISPENDMVGSADDVFTYTSPEKIEADRKSKLTPKADPIQNYEKNIVDEKFSDFVNNEFSLVLSLDEILRNYYQIAELKMQIQPLKNAIEHLTEVHEQLNKLHLAINYHDEVDPSGIDTESLETTPKLIRVPNHTDELILIATTGMNARELAHKCTSAFEKLKRTIEKYNTNLQLIEDLSSELYEDNWEDCFFNKIILERVRDGKIKWSNVNFAIKIVTTGYSAFETPKMVIGLAYNRIGQKLCHTLDFISPLDEFSMETSLNNLLDAYEKTVKTTKEGN